MNRENRSESSENNGFKFWYVSLQSGELFGIAGEDERDVTARECSEMHTSSKGCAVAFRGGLAD